MRVWLLHPLVAAAGMTVGPAKRHPTVHQLSDLRLLRMQDLQCPWTHKLISLVLVTRHDIERSLAISEAFKDLGLKDAARGVGGRLTDLAGSIVLMHNDVSSPRRSSAASGAPAPAKYIMRMVLAVRSLSDSYEVIVGGGVSVQHSSIADVTLQQVKEDLGTDADVLDDFIESLTSASLPCFLSIHQVGASVPQPTLSFAAGLA